MVTLRNAAGQEIEAEGEVVEALAHTSTVLFNALVLSTAILRMQLMRHVEEDHGGDWNADCGMLRVVRIHESIVAFGTGQDVPVMAPSNTTCH